jgi:MYXO-CTERM domain-containing protein
LDGGTSNDEVGTSNDGAESSGAGKCAVRPSGNAGGAAFVSGLLVLLGLRRRR